MEDINTLDPFAAILNNIAGYKMTRSGNILILKPTNVSQPTYKVLVGENGLPKEILLKKDTYKITIEYLYIKVKT